MTLTFQDAINALENKPDCQTATKHLRHMAMKDEQEAVRFFTGTNDIHYNTTLEDVKRNIQIVEKMVRDNFELVYINRGMFE